MANPQKENGHVMLANELIEAFCKYMPGHGEARVLWAIIRKTYGWNKKQDAISIGQLKELTGLSRRRVIVCLGNLEAKKMIIIHRQRERGKNEVNQIQIQKNYDLWVVTEKSEYYRKDLQKRILRRKKTKAGVVTDNKGSDGHEQKVVTDIEKVVTDIEKSSDGVRHPQKTIQKTIEERRKTPEKELSPKAIQDYWNSKTKLPKIRTMTDTRKNKLKTRLMEDDFAENWKMIIDKIAASSFCTGNNNRGWKADIDWLLTNSANYIKILEGKYDNQKIGKTSACAPIDPIAAAQRQRFLTGKA